MEGERSKFGSRRELLGALLVSGLIASVDGPPDANWDSTRVAELDRRVKAARQEGEPASEWSEVRVRLPQRTRPMIDSLAANRYLMQRRLCVRCIAGQRCVRGR
jgi:hypothetical protein